MKPKQDIASFIYLLNEEPEIFLPTSWHDLPKLQEEIAKLADNEPAIIQTIKDWCVDRGLGENLRDCVLRKDFDDAGEPTPSTTQPLTNITQTLRQEIEEAYQKLQKLDANNRSNSNNDSK